MILHVTGTEGRLIEARHAQRSFGDGFITAEIDAMLADEAMVSAVHQVLARRHPQSRRRGKPGFPAEVVLRLLILKHIRNWSGRSAPIWYTANSPTEVDVPRREIEDSGPLHRVASPVVEHRLVKRGDLLVELLFH